MTYEEFKHLAEHPQHRDVPAIFKLEVLETEELEEKKRSHYPKYKVNTYCPQAFTTTLEKERMMGQLLRCQAWVLLFLRYSIILASMVSSMVHAIGTSSSSSFSRVSSPSSHTFGRTVWRSGSLPAM